MKLLYIHPSNICFTGDYLCCVCVCVFNCRFKSFSLKNVMNGIEKGISMTKDVVDLAAGVEKLSELCKE